MSTPPPHPRPDGTPWAAHWIDDARASLPEAPPQERPACAARLAAMLFACGRDEEGEAVLAAARREAARAEDLAGIARIEIAVADGAVTRDDDPRAHGHLAAGRRQVRPVSPSIRARAWIVEARLARAEASPPPAFVVDDPDATQEELLDPSERLDLGAEVSLERAVIARLASDWTAARTLLERARELASTTSSPRLIGLVEVEIGLYAAEVDDPKAACERIRTAIDLLHTSGLARDEGRAMIQLAELIASKGIASPRDSAALWLGRAKTALGDAATWRDRSAIRTGFRAHGRRNVDRAMTEATVAGIEAFERGRGALLGGISASVEAVERALTELEAHPEAAPLQPIVDRVRKAAVATSATLAPAVGDIDRVVGELIDTLGGALVERDRLRSLLSSLAEVDAATDEKVLPVLVARVAARILEADQVVVALVEDGELEPAGRAGEGTSGSSDLWKSAATAVIHGRGEESEGPSARTIARRGDGQGAGPVLVVRMRDVAAEVDGVIYADKLARSGQFREHDHALAGALAEHAALALGRLRAHTRECAALRAELEQAQRTPPRPEAAAPRGTLPSVQTEEIWVPEPGSFSQRAPILPLLELEKKAYLHALEKSSQSVARAAEALGVSKVTFYAKLRSWGMHPRDRFDDEGPTNVRRARLSSSSGRNEPFEPPTRTSSTKIRTEK